MATTTVPVPSGADDGVRAAHAAPPRSESIPLRGAHPDAQRPRWTTPVLAVAVLIGAALRLLPVLRTDFPVNDGGLFYLMTQELQRAHFVLPAFTSYNGAGLPYGYPPLAFYMAGALASVTGWPLIDIVRVLPAVFSVLTLPVFALLAWQFLRDPVERVAAVFAFALLPRTFTWFVMGGGLPRAPGFLFALLTIYFAFLFYTRGNWRYAAATAVVGGLAIVTHLENAFFAIYSSALVFALYGRHRRGLVGTLLIGAGVFLVTVPWWGTVVHYHGWQPFISARQASGYAGYPVFALRTLQLTSEMYLPVLGVLGLLGLIATLGRRGWFVPVWFGVILVVNARNPLTPLMVPLSLMIGTAVSCLLVHPLLRVGAASAGATADVLARDRPRFALLWPGLVTGGALAAVVGYVVLSDRAIERNSDDFAPLTPADRDAMQWVTRTTPPGSPFLVLTFDRSWFGNDQRAEWFPALTARPSVGTVQAYEWLPGKQFVARGTADSLLRLCSTQDVACVERWAAEHGQTFQYVYAGKSGNGKSLLAAFRASPQYAPVFENGGVVIFTRRAGADAGAVPPAVAAR